MIPSFCTESKGKPILASLALVGMAIVIRRWYPHLKVSSRENGEDRKYPKNDVREEKIQCRTKDDGYSTESTKEHRFPWEPNYIPKGRNTDESTKQTNNSPERDNVAGSPPIATFAISRRRHESRTTERSCTEELEFLATMTFANGGLRSPTCPCCV